MGRGRAYKGKSTQGDNPDWRPLVAVIGDELAADFMWMYEVELSTGARLQVYKHIDTRRSIHLDADGEAFAYESPDRYRSIPVADVLAEVFVPLFRLSSVAADQATRSWEAVERLERDEGGDASP
jgi:hypothetical protein